MSKNNVTIEDLAIMVQKGFEKTTEDIKQVDERLSSLEEGQVSLEEGQVSLERGQATLGRGQAVLKKTQDEILFRVGNIERELKRYVPYDEFEDLMARVKFLETHLGVKSGK